MIIEYTKPWNNNKVWLDTETKEVVFKDAIRGRITKFNRPYRIITKGFDRIILNNDRIKSEYHLDIGEDLIEEIEFALQKAFTELEKHIHPFLCPHCRYGYYLQVTNDIKGYFCKKRSIATRTVHTKIGDFEQIMADIPENYENGPGGWDGETCPNFIHNHTNEIKENKNG